MEDRRKRFEELKKTKRQDCGQIGHWAGDSICPKRKSTGHLAVSVGDECPHEALDHRGSSKSISRTVCMQRKTFINEVSQVEKKERKQVAAELEAKGSDDAISAAQSLLTQAEKLLTKADSLA